MNNEHIVKTTDEIDRLWTHAEPVVAKLMQDLSMNFISYTEVDAMGVGITLSNNSSMFRDFVELGYQLVCPFPDRRSQTKFRYFIDENADYSDEVAHSIKAYGIQRVLSFVDISSGTLKILCVGFSSSNALVINRCLSEEVYLRYMMTELSLIIEKESRYKFQFIAPTDNAGTSVQTDLQKLAGYIPRLSPLVDDYMRLTSQEQRVINYTLRGFNAKQIADMLCVSSRTVEHHFYQLKHKIDCSSKHDIVKYFMPLARVLEPYTQLDQVA